MKILFSCTTLILTFFIMSSCHQQPSPSLSTGPVGQITVVCDNNIWNDQLLVGLDSTLCQFLSPYFPDVIEFSILQRSPQKFNAGNKQMRNVVNIKVDPAFSGQVAQITLSGEKYATNQTLIHVLVANVAQLKEAIATRFKTEIYPLLAHDEWYRLYQANKKANNKDIQNNLAKNFGIHVDFPQGSTLVTTQANFYRIEFVTESKSMETGGERGINTVEQAGMLIYQYDGTSLDKTNLLMARDTMLKYNVPHEIEGVYMATQYAQLVAPEIADFQNYNGTLVGKEIRGMFKFIDERNQPYTGGAFWEFHFLHPSRKKVVCVSGYLDAPSTVSWVFQLRRIQAVLKSIKLEN